MAEHIHPQSDSIKPPGSLLALGIEQRVMRACLLEPVSGEVRLAGWINVQRDPTSELTQQIKIVCQRMGGRLGRVLWDDVTDAPLLQSEDPVAFPPIHQVLAASTPRPLLRVWLAGVSVTGSMATAAEAVVAAPARVVGQCALTASTDSSELAAALSAARPDVLVITGGYDNPTPSTHRPVYQLSKVIADALRRLPPGQYPLIIYAGDRWLAAPVAGLLATVGDALPIDIINNVRPTPTTIDPTPLSIALTRHHRQLSERMPGFTRLGKWVTSPSRIVSMEAAFTQCTRVWMEYQGLDELHALYFAQGWRLHVWARQDDERETAGQQSVGAVRMRYVGSSVQSFILDGWPSVELVSGLPLQNQNGLSPRWWDRSGMLPIVATVGQIAPHAMIEVLQQDLLESAGPDETRS